MAMEDFFNSTADIFRISRTQDGEGSWTETEVPVVDDAPCCIQPRRGIEFIDHERKVSNVTHKMYCRVVADIQPNWRVRHNGTTYDILAVRNIDFLNRFLTLDLKEVD